MKRVIASSVVCFAFLAAPMSSVVRSAEVDAQDVIFLKQTVESQQETIDGLKRRLATIESQLAESRRELDTVRRTITTLTKDLVTQDQLHALASKVEQVDTNRVNDSKRLYEALKKIADAPPVITPTVQNPIAPPPERRTSRPPVEPTDNGSKASDIAKSDGKPTKTIDLPPESYQHIVKPNETLSEILIAYRKEYGLKTTMAHVEAANPGINPKRLKMDQKINIPVVK